MGETMQKQNLDMIQRVIIIIIVDLHGHVFL